MLDTSTCKWQHIILGFQATAHKEAAELASILKKIRSIWLTVGKTKFAEECAIGAKKKDTAELLSKTAMLSLLGSWGRTKNYRYNMITTDHVDNVLFEGQIETKEWYFP